MFPDFISRDVSLGRPFGFPLRVSRLLLLAMAAFAVIGLARKNWLEMVWLPMLVLSIACHELGHALSARRFGAQVHGILLHVYGGLTVFHGGLPARESMLVSLAGPAVNLGLAALTFGAARLTGFWSAPVTSELGAVLLALVHLVVWANTIWGIFNLLPIWPLDGGQVTRVLLLKRLAEPLARFASAALSLGVLAGVVVLALWWGPGLFTLVILAGLGYINWIEIQRARASGLTLAGLRAAFRRPRGERPGPTARPAARPNGPAAPLREAAQDGEAMRALLQRCARVGFERLSPDERRLVVYHRNLIETLLAKGGYEGLSLEDRRLLALHQEIDRRHGVQ